MDHAILHDDEKVPLGIGKEAEIVQRIAIDEQQVGIVPLVDETDAPPYGDIVAIVAIFVGLVAIAALIRRIRS